MEEFILKNSDIRMRYHDFHGNGAPILFIHGLGCAGSFDYPRVALGLSGNRRIVVDLIGAGYSDKPKDFKYRVRDHAEYLCDFISFLKLEKFILFGHSLGGAVALSLASRCESRIDRIVLAEPNLDAGGGSTSRAIASYSYGEFAEKGFQNIIIKSKKHSNSKWAASFSLCSPKAVYDISKSAIDGDNPSWREILYSLRCPKTLILGEKSLPNPATEILPGHGVHIEIVRDAGHLMALDNPEGLAAAIRNGIALN